MDEEMVKILEDMDMSWEEKKAKQLELTERKRRRMSQEPGIEEDIEEGTKKKRVKRRRYAVMEDDWGLGEESGRMEDDPGKDQDHDIVPPPSPTREDIGNKVSFQEINLHLYYRLLPEVNQSTKEDG